MQAQQADDLVDGDVVAKAVNVGGEPRLPDGQVLYEVVQGAQFAQRCAVEPVLGAGPGPFVHADGPFPPAVGAAPRRIGPPHGPSPATLSGPGGGRAADVGRFLWLGSRRGFGWLMA